MAVAPPSMAVPPHPYSLLPIRLRATLERSWEDRRNGVPGTEAQVPIPSELAANPRKVEKHHAPLALAEYDPLSSTQQGWTTWQAIDELSDAILNVMAIIHERIEALDPAMWDNVRWLRNIWIGSSAGFKCEYFDRRRAHELYDSSRRFCKDDGMGASEHPGCECWREVPVGNTTWALHGLVGVRISGRNYGAHSSAEMERSFRSRDEVHLDWISPVEERESNGVCNYAILRRVVPHLQQVKLGAAVERSPFYAQRALVALRQRIRNEHARGALSARETRQFEARATVLESELRAPGPQRQLACQGLSGWLALRPAAQRVWRLERNVTEAIVDPWDPMPGML